MYKSIVTIKRFFERSEKSMKKNKRLKIKDTIYTHIHNNSKEYIIVTLIFVIGLFLGVMFINNTSEAQMTEVSSYFSNFVDKLKNTEDLEIAIMLKTTILENVILAVTLWFFGTTVIRNTNCIWNNIV